MYNVSPSKKNPLSVYLVLILLISIVVGGYLVYSYWNTQKQKSSVEISLDTAPNLPASSPSPANSLVLTSPSTDELEKLRIVKNNLQSQNASLRASLRDTNTTQEQLKKLLIGRGVLSDFGERFFKYEKIIKEDSFFNFFNKLVLDYIENRSILTNSMNRNNSDFNMMHREFNLWILNLDEIQMESLAHFVGFYLVEHLYQMPLTLVASGLSTEIEVIDFEKYVFVKEVKTPPIRDTNGELKMGKASFLDGYTSAQQFFYRRGPQFTEKVLIFLRAYLAYEGY